MNKADGHQVCGILPLEKVEHLVPRIYSVNEKRNEMMKKIPGHKNGLQCPTSDCDHLYFCLL